MNTIKILKSSNAVIVVLVLALLAQMPHAQYVLYSHSKTPDWWSWSEASIGAIALEIAVLVFTVRGNVRVSWGFAAFSVSINLIYYYDKSVAWWIPSTDWLLAAGLPVAIALYSHEVMEPQSEIVALQSEPKQPSKRVTRTVSVARTETESEQYTLQAEHDHATIIVQPATPLQLPATMESDTPIEFDIASMSIEQKKQHFATVLRAGGKVNKSAFASQYGVARTTIIRWLAELQPA